jgi:tetratricopeptide (TPR) repeat protein
MPYTGDIEGARDILVTLIQEDPDAARALHPTDPWDTCLLADAYLIAGRASEALALLQPLVTPHKGKRVRELAPIHSRIARGAAELGDRAGEVYALVQALECDSQNAEICSEVGLRALELGELELGARAFRAVTLIKTPGPISRALAYQHLGEIAQRQGDSKRAVAFLKRAVTEDPELQTAKALLDAIEQRA